MFDAIDALGRALHHTGRNISRTELSVVVRELGRMGYVIERKGARTFHTQPAEDPAGSPEKGSGRV